MKSELPIWVQYAQALSIPILALVAAFIAYGQYRTAFNKLKLDLYEKRLEVFISARKFIDEVESAESPDNKPFIELWRARDGANFLFGPEIVKLLEKIHDEGFGVRTSIRELKTANGKNHHDLAEKNSAHLAELLEIQSKLPTHFAAYMGFSNIKGDGWLQKHFNKL